MVPWFYAGCSFTVFAFCIQELCCLDFMTLVLFTTFGLPHFGIMLPRFHVPCFIYGIWILHPLFWNYVASILCSFFFLRYVHSELCCLAFCILELCCLDSMFLLSFTEFKFCIPHSGIMLPRFYNHWLFTHRIWNST